MYTSMNNIKNKLAGISKFLLMGVLIFVSCNIWAQEEQELRGRIVDSEGKPITGAVVNVAEQSRIALSDEDGYFSLKNVKLDDELCVSSIGYKNATGTAEFSGAFQIDLLGHFSKTQLLLFFHQRTYYERPVYHSAE